MNIGKILSATPTEPFMSMGVLAWLFLCLIGCLMVVALVFFWSRIRTLKNQKAEVESQLLERTELLTFSKQSETRALEKEALAYQNKQQLLGRINREIRTPMNGVIGMSALLAETSLNNEQQEYNETIRNSGESLLSLIADLLYGDMLSDSKIAPDKALEPVDFDLRNSIEEVLEMFAAKTARADVELVYRIDRLVPTRIVGDSARLRQILVNLVENAVNFTPHGEIVVSVKLPAGATEPAADGNSLLLSFEVRDTGIGIPVALLEGLSGKLADENPTTTQPIKGVGLALCKQLVNMMGGAMTLSSSESGTKVTFTIRATSGTAAASAYRVHDMEGLTGTRVLIVDDNLTSAHILKEEFDQLKLLVSVARSGKEALAMITQATTFDIVLTDLKMPEMDGIKFAESVHQQYPKLPIILLGNERDEIGRHHAELFTAIVNKPIRLEILTNHIISKLRQRDSHSSNEPLQTGRKLSADFSKQYPLRILIAEDNKLNQKLAVRILGKLGYEPEIAGNGKEVLEIVSNSKYDLILMDVQMPEMDGLEATRMIRLCLEVQPVIVAMTVSSMPGDREKCLQAGMDGYLSKPIHLDELVGMVEKWALKIKGKRPVDAPSVV